jgi:hypothetical protein
MVAWAGLSGWDHLPQQTKRLVWASVTTAMVDAGLRRDILAWSIDFGLSDFLVRHLDDAGLRQLEQLRRQRAARKRPEAKSAEH